MKDILIAGASGFVGQYLSRLLIDAGHQVVGLGTSGSHPLEQEGKGFTWVSADTSQPGEWQTYAKEADVIINLAGRSIFSPWTRAYKEAIYNSRVLTTRHLVAALPDSWDGVLLNASAAGIYGDGGEEGLLEDRPPGSDFLARVCVDWEKEALRAVDKGARVCLMRFGVVLGQGGALTVMSRAFKFFAGGPLGTGRQWFPWIHIQDLARAVTFLMERDVSGPFNFTGPEPLRQKDFAKALGRALWRPAITPAPAFMVRLIMGELGASLLMSQKAVPGALAAAGFDFSHSRVEDALAEIYGQS